MIKQTQLQIATPGRTIMDITSQITDVISQTTIATGLCNLFIHHTSASLLICENHDPAVLRDMEAFMQRLVPDGDSLFEHTEEGPDDMSSHVRAVLTETSLTIPITDHRLALGTWQGIFLWEHRHRPHPRKLTITLLA